jgi:hypothetical protein
MENYICHSGGCLGSDMMWEIEGNKYGVKTIAYSFFNHTQESENQKILSIKELEEGFEHVKIADLSLKRKLDNLIYPYVKNLLSRNWFQVKNSESVFAIGMFGNESHTIVDGGTGWAVQMAIDNKKDVFLFNQPMKEWNKYDYEENKFNTIDYIPKLTVNFAGIGTRKLNVFGELAIKEIYRYNFKK